MSSALTPTQTAATVKAMLGKNKTAIMASLPRGFNFDRMCRTVINAISTTPAVAECTPDSIFLSCVKSFSMGLEPNGPLGEAYLVPFKNSKKGGVREAQFMPGYRGLIQLARRGEVATIYAEKACKNDEFTVELGSDKKLIHKPNMFSDRGETVGYYAVFTLKDGSSDFEVMTVDDIQQIRKRSKSGNNGPWQTDFDEMAKKTVIKRLLKRAPMSIELADAVQIDNKAAMGEDMSTVIDVEGITIDETQQPQPAGQGMKGLEQTLNLES